MIDTNWIEAIRVVIGALLGMVCVGAATEGWFLIDSPWWERIIFLVGGLLLIEPSIMTDLIGAGLMVFAIFLQVVRRKKRQTPTPRGAAVA